MGVTISLYEQGSCSDVEQGQSVGRFPFFIVDAPDRGVDFGEECYTTEYTIREILQDTSLETNIYPDFNVIAAAPSIDQSDFMVMYSTRDRSCFPQPRETADRVIISRNLDEVVCQDVTNGFVLYCYNSADTAAQGPRPCRNIQSLVQGTIDPVELSETEQLTQELKELRTFVSGLVN